MKRVHGKSQSTIENNDEIDTSFSKMEKLLGNECENDFLIFENGKIPLCLVCRRNFEWCNEENVLKRHYEILHSYDFEGYKGNERQQKIKALKSHFQPQTTLTEVEKTQQRLSYKISLEIAQQGRAYEDADFAHRCIMTTMRDLCRAKCDVIEEMYFSSEDIAQQIFELSHNLEFDLREKLKKCAAYSLAFDLSQQEPRKYIAVFIRHLEKFFSDEDLLQIIPITDTTTDEDLLFILKETIDDFGLFWKNLFSISVTEDFVEYASSGLGSLKTDRFENLIHNYAKTWNPNHNVVVGPCLFRVEDLCPKKTSLKNVMDSVVKIINRIRVYGSNRHEFRSFLTNLETNYCEDIPWNATDSTDVNWLNISNLLKSFVTSTENVKDFLKTEESGHQLDDAIWLLECAFLSDIMEHLETLNGWKDTGSLILFVEKISAFKLKVLLWMEQLKTKNFCHFPTMEFVMRNRSIKKETINVDLFVDILQQLHTRMETRFGISKKLEKMLEIYTNPFQVEASTVDPTYQLQLIDLQRDKSMLTLFQMCVKNCRDFYVCFPETSHREIYKLAQQILSVFGSTNISDRVSSSVKKCRINSPVISYVNLKSMVRIMITDDIPDVDNVLEKVT